MKWNVIDPRSARYYEKPGGGREWRLSREDAMRISEQAVVVALDERNLNESLNCYFERKLFKQLHYDEHMGWTS